MFLSTPACKKAFKVAFSSYGLTVARRGDFLYISGSGWRIQLDWGHVPNKVKASIVELCGCIPEEGAAFKANKEEEQFVFCDTINDVTEDYKTANVNLAETNVLIDKGYRAFKLFQEKHGGFYALDTKLWGLIDCREIDFEAEGTPSGPCTDGYEIFYHTCLCTLAMQISELETEEDILIKDKLSGIQFKREALG